MANQVDRLVAPDELNEWSRADIEHLIGSLESQVENLLETSDSVVMVVDAWGTIRRINNGVKEQLCLDPASVVGKPVDVLLAEADSLDDEAYISSDAIATCLIDGGIDRPVAFKESDGDVVPMRLRSSKIRNKEGGIEGFVCHAQPHEDASSQRDLLQQRSEQTELLNQIVRHDIRNDANVIIESIRRLRHITEDETHETDQVIQLLDQVEQAAARIVDLTERIRDLMNAFEELDRERVPVDLGEVLIEEIAYATTISEGANVVLADDLPEVDVLANEMLSSVIQNLLTNAIEHNDNERPTVHVEVDIGDDEVTVSIADDGPGLPEYIETAINAEGVDLDQFATASFGLYIVQTLIARYGGELVVETTEGEGTSFHVTLERA